MMKLKIEKKKKKPFFLKFNEDYFL